MAIECPVPQPAGTPGVIQETPAQIDELVRVLASGDLGPQVPMVINALRARHPDASAGSLVNYLVTAYCPIVSQQTGLSDAQKQSQLDAFSLSYSAHSWDSLAGMVQPSGIA
jgi:hypothetical protein